MSHKQSTFRAGTEREQRQWHVWVCVCVGVCRTVGVGVGVCACGLDLSVCGLSLFMRTQRERAPLPVLLQSSDMARPFPSGVLQQYKHSLKHRRRKYTEEKAKVVAAVWGTEIIQFLALLAILHWDDFDE